MSKLIEQQLNSLTSEERARLKQLAADAGMTITEWVEYSQKGQIYANAEERLKAKPAA